MGALGSARCDGLVGMPVTGTGGGGGMMGARGGAHCDGHSSGIGVRGDRRGVYAPFIAIIASALLLLGGIAYDAPRLTAARQDAAHAASEAARVAAITIASGGSHADAVEAAENRMGAHPLIYGEEILVAEVNCVGTRVEVTVVTGYVMRSVLAVARNRQPIIAIGGAEAVLLTPYGEPEALDYLGECPIRI